MRRLLLGASIVPMCLLGLAMGIPAQARAIAVPVPYMQAPTKVAQSDLIVTGQVMAIEDQDVKATIAPNSNQTLMYRIAVVQVKETLKGKATNNLVRVGFQAPAVNNNPAGGVGGVQPGQPPINRPVPLPFPGKGGFIGGAGQPLTVGQDGLFYLKQHHEGKFFTLPAYYSYVSSQNKAGFDNEVNQVRTLTKVLANAPAALKSNNPTERIEAAVVLIRAYRTQQGPSKIESVDAEESKLILKALLDADWTVNPKGGNNYQNHPAILFNSLGLNQQNGGFQANLAQGVLGQAYIQSARDWLEKNWQTYRIQKFVPTGNVIGGPNTGVIGPIIGQPVAPIGPVQGGPLVPPGNAVPLPQPVPAPQPLPAPGDVQILPPQVQGGVQIQPLPVEKK